MTIVDTDTLLHVIEFVSDRTIGVDSPWATKEHPGSNKLVEGWKWDIRTWPTTREIEGSAYISSLWDPSVSGLEEDYWQSGYGDGDDLLLQNIERYSLDNTELWVPRLTHGHYYIFDKEWYFHSDDYQTELFRAQNVVSGMQYLDLSYLPKTGIPLHIRRYRFDSSTGRHLIDQDFAKKVEFTTSGIEPEFIIDTDYSPYRLWLSSNFSRTIGVPITVTGTPEGIEQISGLEIVGISDGGKNQGFRIKYSPVDTWETHEVWSWLDPAVPTQWDIISGYEDFSLTGYEVKIDSDYGLLEFGNYDPTDFSGSGIVPSIGSRIGIHYTTVPAVQYEPNFGRDYILGSTADVHPLHNHSHRGFILLSTDIEEPASVTLDTDLSLSGDYYLIYLGNNIGTFTATVRNSGGTVLEGTDVVFEVIAPAVGTFGGSQTEITAQTDPDGEAIVIYNPPTLVDDIAFYTDTVSVDGGDTEVIVSGIELATVVSGICLYKVHSDDPTLGVPADEVSGYYQAWIDGEDITTGGTADVDWEQTHRLLGELGRIASYELGDLTTGKKTIILTSDRDDVINPLTGERDSGPAPYPFVPLYPSLISTDTASGLSAGTVTYTGTVLPIPPASNTKSYMLVGNALASIRASAQNPRTGRRVYSNTVDMMVALPDTVDGTYYADVLNDIPSGLLLKPRNLNDFSDDQIDATSGVADNYETYLKERIVRKYVPHWIEASMFHDELPGVVSHCSLVADLYIGSLSGSPIYTRRWNYIDSNDRITVSGFLPESSIDEIDYTQPLILKVRAAGADGVGWAEDGALVGWIRLIIGQSADGKLAEQALYPISTTTLGSWTGSPHLTDPHLDVDDQDNSDYMQAQNTDACVFELASGINPTETYLNWYRRTRVGDVEGHDEAGYSLIHSWVTGALPADIPLGFRLRDSNITMASVLDSVTYLDPNNDDTTSGYYGV